jgi:FkbM family methyltransferase
MPWHSQFGEDRWLFENGYCGREGNFCEVGAYDGVSGSNTLAFEEMGWKGICLEPDPELAAQCHRNRQARTFNCAAGSEQGIGNFYVNHNDRGTSSLLPSDWKPIQVTVLPLSHLLSKYVGPLDLLSIDTEGTELDVLVGLRQFRPRIMIIEFWTQPNPPRLEVIQEAARSLGYHQIHQTEANALFEKDPNV